MVHGKVHVVFQPNLKVYDLNDYFPPSINICISWFSLISSNEMNNFSGKSLCENWD